MNQSVMTCRACVNCMHHDVEFEGKFYCTRGLNPAISNLTLNLRGRTDADSPADLHPVDQMAQFCDQYAWGPYQLPNFRFEAMRRRNTEYRMSSPARLAIKFEQWYRPKLPTREMPRIVVAYPHDSMKQFGTVVMSTGPEPILLLMRAAGQRGSWVTLDENTKVLGQTLPRPRQWRGKAVKNPRRTHFPYEYFTEPK